MLKQKKKALEMINIFNFDHVLIYRAILLIKAMLSFEMPEKC